MDAPLAFEMAMVVPADDGETLEHAELRHTRLGQLASVGVKATSMCTSFKSARKRGWPQV